MFDSPMPFNDPQSLSSSNHPPPSFSQLLALNSSEWKQAVIGSLAATMFGAVQPVYALTVGKMISAFFVLNHEEMNSRIRTYSIIFCSLSIISILVNILQHYNFAYMGETKLLTGGDIDFDFSRRRYRFRENGEHTLDLLIREVDVRGFNLIRY
ncbi:unnamed protein product [Lactuca virosa]|uniref:ABC transmembrane type-1 domain-containing protein n=1 Tax=Lactuca virosa TaxID=75947 RepID=A0AAU9PDZ6_9ASTR|nr:unnamed protein product [Lactuca virosa]